MYPTMMDTMLPWSLVEQQSHLRTKPTSTRAFMLQGTDQSPSQRLRKCEVGRTWSFLVYKNDAAGACGLPFLLTCACHASHSYSTVHGSTLSLFPSFFSWLDLILHISPIKSGAHVTSFRTLLTADATAKLSIIWICKGLFGCF